MQPVQDLTVEDRVSRTQYQYSLEDPDPAELTTWAPRLVATLRTLPELSDVASDQQNGGVGRTSSSIATRRRGFGVTPQNDRRRAVQRLRPAAGVDDLHAAESVPRGPGGRAASISTNPAALKDIYVRRATGSPVRRLSTFAQLDHGDRRRCRSTTRASFPG